MAALGENAAGDAAWQRFAMGVASTLLSGGPLRLPDAVGAATASAAGDATWQRFAMGEASTLLSGGPLRLPDAVGVATAPVSCPLAECLGGEPTAEIATAATVLLPNKRRRQGVVKATGAAEASAPEVTAAK